MTIAFNAVSQCKVLTVVGNCVSESNLAHCSLLKNPCIFQIGLATALRYAMTRRAFAPAPGMEEVLLLDYPTHQRRLLPLLGKT